MPYYIYIGLSNANAIMYLVINMTYKETDLYEPIRKLLAEQGFTVRGEVKGCDIAAVKDDALWVVEMKLGASLKLVYQGLSRLAATDYVFLALPRPRMARDKSFTQFKNLIKKLGLGLITVALDSPLCHAEILLFPQGKDNKRNKKTVRLKNEVAARTADSPGGSNKMPINTAYRERCVQIATLLEAHGALNTRELVNKYGCEKGVAILMKTNIFNWYKKVSRACYVLSEDGKKYLDDNTYADAPAANLVAYYRIKASENI